MSVTDIRTAEQVVYLPVAEVRPAPDNPRGEDLGDLTDLANSIRSMGVLQPVLVTPRPEEGQPDYMMVLGHRRLGASVLAEQDTIRTIVQDMSEVDRIAAMNIENVQREDLTPIQEARSLHTLRKVCGLSQREIAKKIGKSQAHISKRLSLLDLPDEVQREVDAGRLVIGDAVELARLKDDKTIREIVKVARYEHPVTREVAYNGIPHRVADAIAKKEREQKVRSVTRALRADGVTVIDYPRGGGFTSAETGKRLGEGFGRVNISPEAHADEPCHAAAVNPEAEIVYVCTDPDRHALTVVGDPQPDGTPDPDDPTGEDEPATVEALPTDPEEMAKHRENVEWQAWAEWERRERERERAELDVAAAQRDTFIADLLRRKPTNTITTYVLTAFLAYVGVNERAAGWLGIEGETPVEREERVGEFAGQSLANLTRAALAAVLEDTEAHVRSLGFAAFLDTDIREHLDFLIANGYQPTDIEQRGLATIEPAEDEQPETVAGIAGEGDRPEDEQPESETEPVEGEPAGDEQAAAGQSDDDAGQTDVERVDDRDGEDAA